MVKRIQTEQAAGRYQDGSVDLLCVITSYSIHYTKLYELFYFQKLMQKVPRLWRKNAEKVFSGCNCHMSYHKRILLLRLAWVLARLFLMQVVKHYHL